MFKIFERLWYRLFGFWYPLQYENYKDVSYSKIGAPSHTIIYINLMNGKLKTVHYFIDILPALKDGDSYQLPRLAWATLGGFLLLTANAVHFTSSTAMSSPEQCIVIEKA